ncbi:LysM peptidoglycan-binding domain-containing protein [Bacillus tequilensis]|uniref:LysM peptidoglycan-binding domain-containing protein n=1 Tax=Bacillus tequilensis TaxID=227866 RepID=UPI00046480BF|nr:LysM peptidoglycan-binding domain-containing protein [Bacillus tequilensis]MDR4435957.1 LysM peptidoglycan-binding domain-containing protein [Bacillus tequilensis]
MPQNHRLQFSVEETICFQKGQEVSELLSISLDPDIRVQEVNDYVSIRGSLELTGEYNIDQNKHTEEFYTDKRFVEEVRQREDGSAELIHCFPVDITIPKNKVSHLQDVFVFIDAFDYQLTDSRILTIQADLAIEGLLDDTAVKEPEIPLYEAPAAFREEELTEPPIQSAAETDGPPAEETLQQDETPELFVSKAVLREELETEKAEAGSPESASSEPEAKYGAETPELVVQEEESREETETEEASEIEIQEIVKAEKQTPEPAAAIADVRGEADTPAETEPCEHSRAEESPSLEAELDAETMSSEETAESAASPILEYASRQEGQLEHAEPALRQEEKEADLEPVLRQEEAGAAQSEQADPALRQEAEDAIEAPEPVSEAVLSIDESREKKTVSAEDNEEAAFHFHFGQKASLEEERQQEESPVPAYRTFLPEQEEEEEDSFYSAPKLLEEEEREEEGFEIEVRKIPPAEEPEEETPFQPFQLPDTSETERKEADAVSKAEKKEPQTKENDNSLYLTKLFTREEDEFSRMKICIVQQEDTIERLCERYEITSQQLIRMNSLALDDELKAGQILYIPQNKHSHA